jgi:DME family drug/metabolite transporter
MISNIVNILGTNYIFLSLISALGWSISSIFVKLGVRNKSPIVINIIRLYISSIFWVMVFFINKNFTEIFLKFSSNFNLNFISFFRVGFKCV